MEYIAFDAHKHYTLASLVTPDGQLVREERIEHDRGALRGFLERCERGSPVAVETIGNWYWIDLPASGQSHSALLLIASTRRAALTGSDLRSARRVF